MEKIMKLNLKEVLWEITPKCNRNCAFCGSSDIVNIEDELDWDDIMTIGDNIAKNAETIIMSGGEPLTIPATKLQEIKNICVEHSTNLDIVTNGDLLGKKHMGIFRNIGLSINSLEDIRGLNVELLTKLSQKSDIVFITNLNKLNAFEIGRIIEEARRIRQCHCGFQFQLTMYKDDDDAKIDGEHIKHLRERLTYESNRMQMPYIFADNLQEVHECSAGLNSCGILFNGDVIACLSERSWNVDYEVHGNLLSDDLNDVWRKGFVEQRFGVYDGCRGCFNYEVCTNSIFDDSNECDDSDECLEMITEPFKPNHIYVPPNDQTVILYGVFPPDSNKFINPIITPNNKPPIVYSYGVVVPPINDYTTTTINPEYMKWRS